MADLLGSILGSMEKPPSIGTDERKKAKAEKALQAKQQEAEKKMLDNFKQKVNFFIKEFAPSDEELLAYRKGEEWDPEKNKELQRQRELEEQLEKDRKSNPSKDTPSSNYRDKYKHLIGDEAAKEAARGLVSNSQYGFVPSKNKQDSRTIEQVLADTRARKKQKVEHNPSQSSDTN
uniref:Uncharacterized protein n=1 Tax=Biomphalaria glabrata TaxID=6526 RepID=A0A2C9L863_BIOGL